MKHESCWQSFVTLQESGIDAVDGSSTRHVSVMDMGATKAPMIRRSYLCKQLRQLVSTSQNQCFRRLPAHGARDAALPAVPCWR
jgi:hypothetical protein